MSEPVPPGLPPPAAPPGPPGDEVNWGAGWASLVTAIAIGSQLALAALVGWLARAVIGRLEPALLDRTDELDRLVIQVSLLPIALGYSGVTLALVGGMLALKHRRPVLATLGLSRPQAGRFARFVLTGGGLAASYIGLALLFPPADPEEVGGPLTDLVRAGGVWHLIWIVMAVGLAPIVEEVLFRGYAYLGLRRSLGAPWAGALITIAFVLLHFGETRGYWPAAAGISLVGMALVVIRERTGSLVYCIACHLGYNGVMAILSILAPDAAP